MEILEGRQQGDANKEVKSGSINETIWKVTVVSPYSFKIGDTRMYQPYKGNGLAKQLRTKLTLKFKSFENC
jgi:Ubiquitin-activating enzyme E1 FCCH domain